MNYFTKMILTKSQLEQIQQLRDQQDEWLTEPTEEEYQRMEEVAHSMTFSKYLRLSDEERKKWYINCGLREIRKIGKDSIMGEEWFDAPYYFEPWSTSINERFY